MRTLPDKAFGLAIVDPPYGLKASGVGITGGKKRIRVLYEYLIKTFAKQGDKILDTHLGSGSSRIAAYNLGFDFVGCEINKSFFDKQQERFINECQ